LRSYFKEWYLIPNPDKTTHTCFHLCKAQASQELSLSFSGEKVKYEACPKYVGVHPDRTLSYKTHLLHTKSKISSRNNIIRKLAGTSWGCDAATLRTSALALSYSVADYCSPVWANSSHAHLIYTQLNETMRIVSGTCRTTPLEWLPVLSHIAPPSIQRQNSQLREFLKITSNRPLPINKIIDNPPTKRLKSRKPFWIDGQALHLVNFTPNDAWRDSWSGANVKNHRLVQDPSVCPPGFQLPRRSWTLLNRFRCGQGRCAYLMHKWKFSQDPKCPCGSPQT